MGRVQQIRRGQWDIELYPGWYRLANSRHLHYFQATDTSLCGAHTWHEPRDAERGFKKCSFCEKKLKDATETTTYDSGLL